MEGAMLELLYIARFDYLAHPGSAQQNPVPDDYAVAVAMAEADESASKQQDEGAEKSAAV
jgi:hypothetical protein